MCQKQGFSSLISSATRSQVGVPIVSEDGFDHLVPKSNSQYRLSPSRCVALASCSGRDNSKVEISIVRIQSRNVVRVAVHVIAATDSHTVENVVEFHPQVFTLHPETISW
jgi:hypothetical protein